MEKVLLAQMIVAPYAFGVRINPLRGIIHLNILITQNEKKKSAHKFLKKN